MNAAFWHAFFEDTRVQTLLLLILLDLALGVIAALRGGNFRLAFVADFARNDLLGKVLPFAVVYAGYKFAAGADLIIPGLDMEMIMNGAWVIVLGALVGSILKSLGDLGLSLPPSIAGGDPATPPPPNNNNPDA